jgi:hypothetical protein
MDRRELEALLSQELHDRALDVARSGDVADGLKPLYIERLEAHS